MSKMKRLVEMRAELLAEQFVHNNGKAFDVLNRELEKAGVAPGSPGSIAAGIAFGAVMGAREVAWWDEAEGG